MAGHYGDLAAVRWDRGDLDRAEEMHRKALDINERLGRQEEVSTGYGHLAGIHDARGDVNRAEEMHRKALDIAEQLGWQEGIACGYTNLGLLYHRRGDDVPGSGTVGQRRSMSSETWAHRSKSSWCKACSTGLPRRAEGLPILPRKPRRKFEQIPEKPPLTRFGKFHILGPSRSSGGSPKDGRPTGTARFPDLRVSIWAAPGGCLRPPKR